jgi:antitoxin PrlF
MVTRYKLKVDKQGRLVLPAPVRSAMGIEGGGQVTLELDDDEVHLSSTRLAIRRIQRELSKYVPEGVSLVEELIAERRDEAAREDEE